MRHWHSILLLLVAALAGPAWAQSGKPVAVEVWVIRATTKNSDISPELRGIARALKKQFKYTGFKLEKKKSGRVAIAKPFSADLIGGYRARVTPKERAGKRIKIQVTVSKQAKTVLNTTLTIDAGPFALFGGWQLGGGDALIIAVRAR